MNKKVLICREAKISTLIFAVSALANGASVGTRSCKALPISVEAGSQAPAPSEFLFGNALRTPAERRVVGFVGPHLGRPAAACARMTFFTT